MGRAVDLDKYATRILFHILGIENNMRYRDKWPQYARQWDRMTINRDRAKEFERYAQRLIDNKGRYQVIEKKTGVPWWLVALLHLRESNANFNTYLGNGEPLNRKTRLVPKGRGPFSSFEEGAVDALRLDGLTNVKDWRLEKAIYFAELFNGAGYHNKGLPSPYIWGGSNVQECGKYVADGRFNSKVWDSQPGIAPILAMMMRLDSSIQPIRED